MQQSVIHGHGCHICHKCGWNFPNPHPSAKQRRAHKKVCGKIQGFNIPQTQTQTQEDFHSPIKDDQDHNMGEETVNNEMRSGLIHRELSNRSEEEEFTDTVTEFVDPDLKSSYSASIIQQSDSPTHCSSSRTPQNDAQCEYSSSTMGLVTGIISDKEAESLAFELPKEANGSTFVVPVKTKGPQNPPSEDSRTAENVDSLAFIANGSPSAMKASFCETVSEDSEIVVKLQSLDLVDASDMKEDTLPVDRIMNSKEKETDALGQEMSLNELASGTCSHSIKSEAIENVCSSEDNFQVKVDCACQSGVEYCNDSLDGCNAKEVNKNLLPEPACMPLEQVYETMVKDCKENVPVKSEASPTSDCCEATTEMEAQKPISEEAQSGFLSSKSDEAVHVSCLATQVHEDSLQQEEMCGGNMVENNHEANMSEAKDMISEGLESCEAEALVDATNHDITISPREMSQKICSFKEQESHYSQQANSYKDLPQMLTVVKTSGDSIVSTEDAHETVHSFSGEVDDADKESRKDDSDIAENYIGKEAAEEDSTQERKIDSAASSLSKYEGNLQESKSTPLDINTSHLESTTESLSDPQDSHGENFLESSKELEIRRSFETFVIETIQAEFAGAERSVAEEPHGKVILTRSEVEIVQNDAENITVKESMSSDAGPYMSCSGNVEESGKVMGSGDTSDVPSESLKEVENFVPKKQSDASVVQLDGSVDSFSQTDSVEGHWGSVSDGTVLSLRDAIDAPPILTAEASPGTGSQGLKEEGQMEDMKRTSVGDDKNIGTADIFDTPSFVTLVEPSSGITQQSASAENQAHNLQQLQSSSLEAGWFPSLNHAINESQGRKKNEEIIAKVSNWNSDKLRTPLRSLLVEANFQSKEKAATAQGHPKLQTDKDDATSLTDNVVQAKTAPPMTAPEVSTTHVLKRNVEKEWHSPARLPSNRGKRKSKYWGQFLCCSSVN